MIFSIEGIQPKQEDINTEKLKHTEAVQSYQNILKDKLNEHTIEEYGIKKSTS